MIYKRERCSIEGCNYIVINRTYQLCNLHNKVRLTKRKEILIEEGRIERPPERSKPKSTNTRPKKPIAKMSLKRAEENKEYVITREKKRDWQKRNKYYNCVFCNGWLNEDVDIVDCHHMVGRDGDNLAKWANLFFAHRDCHMDFHSKTVDYLLNTKWYRTFVKKIKKFHREAYNQELRRWNKAGIVDDDQFIEMYKSEKKT